MKEDRIVEKARPNDSLCLDSWGWRCYLGVYAEP